MPRFQKIWKNIPIKISTSKDIELNTKILNEIVLKIKGKALKHLKKETQKLFNQIKIRIRILHQKLDALKSSAVSESLKLIMQKKKSSKISTELDRLYNDEVYHGLLSSFEVNYPETEINENILTDELTKTSSNIKI